MPATPSSPPPPPDANGPIHLVVPLRPGADLGQLRARLWPRRLKVAFDGEREWMAAPLTFRLDERPLWLVADQGAATGMGERTGAWAC